MAGRKRKSNAGRPTKRTPALVAKLVEAFKWDFNNTEACNYAGIDLATYYRWREDNKAFCDEIDQAKEYVTILAKKQHVMLIRKGKGDQVRFHLNARAKDPETGQQEYKEQKHVEAETRETIDLTADAKELLEQFRNATKPNTTAAVRDVAASSGEDTGE